VTGGANTVTGIVTVTNIGTAPAFVTPAFC